MAILRTAVWFILFFLTLIVYIPVMLFAVLLEALGCRRAERRLVDVCVRLWCRMRLVLAGVKVTVTGRENIPAGRAVMFTPNHQGNFDIPVMLTSLDKPHGLLAKIETKKIPLVRTWMRLLGCVFVDRADTRSALHSLTECTRRLEEGESLIVFPEGTRSKGGPMGEFKQGAFRMACKAGVPVVPVAIEGTYRVMEQNGGLIRPAHVRVQILPPIETKGLSRAEQKTVGEAAAAAIARANRTA